jgi:hypothetical protein
MSKDESQESKWQKGTLEQSVALFKGKLEDATPARRKKLLSYELTEPEAMRLLGVSQEILAELTRSKVLPNCAWIDHPPRYDLADVVGYLEARAVVQFLAERKTNSR